MQFIYDNLFDQLWPLHAQWKKLGSAMSLSEELLDEIFTNNEEDESCFRQVLDYYMGKHDKQHSWEEIVSILKKIEAKELAEKINTLHVYPCKPICVTNQLYIRHTLSFFTVDAAPGQILAMYPERSSTEKTSSSSPGKD